ncbi:amino acid permease [Leeia oryzae]|uniref:amino acid permease n=1 Tax=Leeia oryzae TaxID=356662 RepID=UPI00039E17DE|nr:amino acid permease [Leeia oryzae]
MNANPPSLLARMFRCKPIEDEGRQEGPDGLERSMGLFQLTMLGVGATVGTGIFVVLNQAVPHAGPAVIISFMIAGITAALTALCYAELASSIPVSGSSYSYAYATLGEVVAYGVAWCLLLEYGVSASAIAVGWGQYLNEFFMYVFHWRMPDIISQPPGHGGYFNIPAVILVAMCSLLLMRGAKESALINTIMVLVKLAVLVMFVAIAVTGFQAKHLTPFAPMGMSGIGAAASTIFFSYIGIDAVSTAGAEVKNPRRNLPLGIVLSLVIVTLIYMVVAMSAIGTQPWGEFAGQEAGLSAILFKMTGQSWPSIVLSVGAILSIFSVTLVVLYGQTRILYAMSCDGMLPAMFRKVHPKTQTPNTNTMIVGVIVALLAAFVPLDVLTNLTSMGTLVAFAVVSIGVMVLRRTQPNLVRGFKVPLYPVTPVVSILFCLYLIADLPMDTFILFAAWLTVAAIIYFNYSIKNSRLAAADPVLDLDAEEEPLLTTLVTQEAES